MLVWLQGLQTGFYSIKLMAMYPVYVNEALEIG